MSALIVINLQNDFSTGGAYNLNSVLDIIPKVNRINQHFNRTIYVKESHSPNHTSFQDYGGTEPKHCVKNTYGEELNEGIMLKDEDYVVHTGTLVVHDYKSAFRLSPTKLTRLDYILRSNDIDHIYLCGGFLSEQIQHTVQDALRLGYSCTIIQDMVFDKDNDHDQYMEKLVELGVDVVTSTHI